MQAASENVATARTQAVKLRWTWGRAWKGQVRAPEERPCQDGTHNSLGCLFPPMGPRMRIPG